MFEDFLLIIDKFFYDFNLDFFNCIKMYLQNYGRSFRNQFVLFFYMNKLIFREDVMLFVIYLY